MTSKRFGQLIEQSPTDFRVGIFATPEEDGEFDLIPIVQKFCCPFALGLEIVVVDFGPNPHFLQLNNMLILAGLALLAALLITELAVIHEPANRWDSVGRYLDEIQTTFTRHFKRIPSLNNPDLVAQIVNQANFPDTNPIVNPCLNWPSYGLPPALILI